MSTQKITGLTVKSATEKATVLSWDKLITDVGLDFYEVYVDNKCYKSKKNTITIKKLSPGTHTFRIIAIDKNDNEIFSDTVKSFNVKDATIPKAGKITVTQVEGNQDAIKISMNGFSDNKGIDGYIIKVNGNPVEDDFKGTSYTWHGKNLAGKVNVEVIAFDAAGNQSKAAKKKITIKDVTDPTKVTGLSVKSATEKAAVLTWNAASDNVGVTQYEVVVNGKTYKSKTNSITIKKLKAGTASFTVYAVDKAKNKSLVSDKFSFEVADGTAPKAGKITVSQVNGKQNDLLISMSKFSDNKGIYGYIIKVNGNPVEDDFKGTSYTWHGENLAGKKVNVEVIAFDDAGNKSKAAKKKITIKDVTDPTKVTGLKVVSANEKEVKLSWNAASDNVGVTQYEVVINGKTYKSKTNSITIKKLKAGTHKFAVYAVDKAKNKSIVSDSQNIVIGGTTGGITGGTTGGTTGNGIQYFGKKVITEATADKYTDVEFDDFIIREALVSPLKTTSGNDTAVANVNTWSCFKSGIDFGAGDDSLTLQKITKDCISGVEFRGDINFGSGNNKLSAEDADGIYAYNIYFGDGNNTVTCSGSDIESGDHEADKSGEHGESKPGTGKIIFGNGKNKVVIDNNGEIEGALIKFGNGGNTVEINQGWLQTNPFNEYIKDDGYFNDGELDPVLWWNNIQAHGGISKITFGSGNDTIKLAGKKPFSYDYDADNFGVISTFEIDMGAGNDVIDLSSGGWITLCGTVDSNYNSHGGNILLGDGNDSLIMRAGSAIDAYGVIDFGSGDDKFTVASGADIALGGQLDFGEGNDSITIDGKLTVWGYENFAGLENISGSGEIVIRGLVEDDLVKKFEDAGLKVSHLA